MKLSCAAILIAITTLTASPNDRIDGQWKVNFHGPTGQAPKTVGSIVLNLKVNGESVSGLVRIGVWPGDAPIEDGRINGGHISFNATGHLGSTTGIPTCHFEAMINGGEMDLKMTVIRNPGGPLGADIVYGFQGAKEPE